MRLYAGVGAKFLGFHFPDEELLPDGSYKALGKGGYRYWTVPADPVGQLRWRPLYDHLKGFHRGIVANGSLHVPFVAADFDRHDASIDPKDHIVRVLRAGRLLRRNYPDLTWIAEVNPNNGSMKFFGFGNGPIPTFSARKFATEIHDLLLKNGCGAVNRNGQPEIEIFPYNCGQVGLPMRTDKVTVVASGVVPKCVRRRKNSEGQFEKYETYSALAFLEAIKGRTSYDEKTLFKELMKGCGALPYTPSGQSLIRTGMEGKTGIISTECRHRRAPDASETVAKGDYNNDPNSYRRQQNGLLELCRSLGRVATLEEGLTHIRDYGLFTGSWQTNEAKRRSRVAYLLRRIAMTFDAGKCSKVARRAEADEQINIGKYDHWAKTFVGTLKGSRKSVDEFGNIVERRCVSVDWQWVSLAMSVIEYCCVVCPNPDQSLPQHWAEDIWTGLKETGRIDQQWDDRKWKVTREWLELKGLIRIIDRTWRFDHGHGKAMKWAVTKTFDQVHEWWKRQKAAGTNAAVPLSEFLKTKRHSPPLNSYTHVLTEDLSQVSRVLSSRGPP